MKNMIQINNKKTNTMKKIILSILTFATIGASAQLPTGEFGVYEFTNGSLANTSISGTASDLSGTPTAIVDRNGVTNNAIALSGSVNGVNLGATNLLNTTLSFWIKSAPLTGPKRLLQIYGTFGAGYRIDMDNALFGINTKAYSNPNAYSEANNGNYTIDDNAWHHIVVRTQGQTNDTTELIEVFIDGSLSTIIITLDPPEGLITNYLQNASLSIDPLNSFTGAIDDIYLYKSALSNTEITQLYYYPLIIVNSITLQGQGSVSTITSNSGILQMEATILPINAADQTYTWSVANGTGSATIDNAGILTAQTNGTVTVTATANDGSSVSSSTVITISNQTVSINETKETSSLINIYPNPTTDKVTFSITEQISTIELYNLTGQKVAQFQNTNTINISSLLNGIYTAKVIVGSSKPTMHKLVKE